MDFHTGFVKKSHDLSHLVYLKEVRIIGSEFLDIVLHN